MWVQGVGGGCCPGGLGTPSWGQVCILCPQPEFTQQPGVHIFCGATLAASRESCTPTGSIAGRQVWASAAPSSPHVGPEVQLGDPQGDRTVWLLLPPQTQQGIRPRSRAPPGLGSTLPVQPCPPWFPLASALLLAYLG